MTTRERRLALENREKMGKALGILGLHDQRYFNMHADLRLCTTAVSGTELEKLAVRAEHLVELEKLVHDWDPETRIPLIGPILEWAAEHDFSMVDIQAQNDGKLTFRDDMPL